MKRIVILILTLGPTVLTTESAVVRMTLRGIVTETTVGSIAEPPAISVGDSWVTTLTYDYPTPAVPGPFGLPTFVGQGLASTNVGNISWANASFSASIDKDPSGSIPNQQLNMGYFASNPASFS